MIDDLRKELKADISLQVNSATAPLYTETENLKTENYHLKKPNSEISTMSYMRKFRMEMAA